MVGRVVTTAAPRMQAVAPGEGKQRADEARAIADTGAAAAGVVVGAMRAVRQEAMEV
jgi:hypothetical protein